MKSPKMTAWIVGAVAVVLAGLPSEAHACAACFGRSDSRMAQGMNMGIMVLLFFIVGVLAMLSMFFVFLGRRASQHQLPAPISNDLHN